MTFEEFNKKVKKDIQSLPNNWRYGQKVFNYIDANFMHIARDVQLIDGIDCFYDDSVVDEFIIRSYERIKNVESDETRD
jgi:hypothetical protein